MTASSLTDEFGNEFNTRRLDIGIGSAKIKLERWWAKVPPSEEGLVKLKFELHEELDKGNLIKDVLGKAADILFEASANWANGSYSKAQDGDLIWTSYVGDFRRPSCAYTLSPNKASLIP